MIAMMMDYRKCKKNILILIYQDRDLTIEDYQSTCRTLSLNTFLNLSIEHGRIVANKILKNTREYHEFYSISKYTGINVYDLRN